MKKLEIVNSATRAFHRTGLKLKKYSPEILVVAGIAGVVTSAVMACKEKKKIDKVLAETKENIAKTNDYVEKKGYSEDYTEEDHKKDITIFYARGGLELAKLYGPSIALGAVSITAILAGHSILRKRNVALAAAYATVNKGFRDYRSRVIERFGKELDKELKYNIKAKEIEEVSVDAKTGEETVTKKTVNTADPYAASDYAKFFDDGCNGWTKEPEYNLMFLKDQQRYANDLLKSKGHLFLNEVYDMLGIPRTKAGQIVGWIYDEINPVGDNFVDFGIYDVYNEPKRNFVNGYERTILLDFNVDGPILELI